MQENADLVFGGITIICGIFGTVAGGLILDKIGSTIQNGFKVFSILIEFPMCLCRLILRYLLEHLGVTASCYHNLCWDSFLFCSLHFQHSATVYSSFFFR